MRYRVWVFIASGLFVIGLGIGLVISATMPADIVSQLSKELSDLEALGDTLGPFQVTTAAFIFVKNFSVIMFSFILSPALCLFPILVLTLNGLLLSFVSVIVAQKESLGLVVAGLLPHGILEIPALIIGEAAALNFGVMTIMALVSRNKRHQLLPSFKQNLRYLLIAFVLLVPAAIIETYITPLLLQ